MLVWCPKASRQFQLNRGIALCPHCGAVWNESWEVDVGPQIFNHNLPYQGAVLYPSHMCTVIYAGKFCGLFHITRGVMIFPCLEILWTLS